MFLGGHRLANYFLFVEIDKNNVNVSSVGAKYEQKYGNADAAVKFNIKFTLCEFPYIRVV